MRIAVLSLAVVGACSFDTGGLPSGGDGGGTGSGFDAAASDGAAGEVDASADAAEVVDARLIDARVIDAAAGCPADYLPLLKYRYIGEAKSWLAAEADCEDDAPGRTHLVVFDDGLESTALRGAIGFNGGIQAVMWIGVVRYPEAPLDSGWRKVTGGAATYLPWSPGEPDNPEPGNSYVVRWDKGNGNYFDRTIDDTLPAMCECDSMPAMNATYEPPE